MNWTETTANYPRHYTRSVSGIEHVSVRRIEMHEGDARLWRTVQYVQLQTNTSIVLTITTEGDEGADAAAVWLERIGNQAHEAMLREVRRDV